MGKTTPELSQLVRQSSDKRLRGTRRNLGMVLLLTLLGLGFLLSATPSIAQDFALVAATAVSSGGSTSVATIGATIDFDLLGAAGGLVPGPPRAWVTIGINPAIVAEMTRNAASPVPWHDFAYSYLVPPGLLNGVNAPVQYYGVHPATPTVTVTLTPTGPFGQVIIDNRPPETNGSAMQITVAPYGSTVFTAWTGATIKWRESIRFRQDMDPIAYQTGEEGYLNLTSMGGVATNPMNPFVAFHETLTGFIATDSLDGNYGVGFFARDPYGNYLNVNPVITLPIDTRPPVITGATMTVSGLGQAYDFATITVVLSEFDGDTVTASCTAVNPASIVLTRVGATTEFRGGSIIFPCPPRPAFVGNFSADIRVTDNGGNLATTSTNLVAIDNRKPQFDDQPVASLTEYLGVMPNGVGIIGDRILFMATASSEVGQTITVRVNLTPIGIPGVTWVNLTPMGSSYYQIAYTLLAGTAEDPFPISFEMEARDSVTSNIVASWTTPPVVLDIRPPVFSGANPITISVPSGSGVGGAFKVGDTFTLSARVENLPDAAELGAVSVNIASLSPAYPGLTPLAPNVGDPSLFEGTFTVGRFPDQGDGWDIIPTLRFIASDSQGNFATASFTMPRKVDSEFVSILTSEFLPNPATPLGFIRAGDPLEFRIQVEAFHTEATATIDLTALGGGYGAAEVMTASSTPGWYFFTVPSLPEGTLNAVNQVFNVTVRDDDGNSISDTITVPIDNSPPELVTASVISLGGDPNQIIYYDTFQVSTTVNGIDDTTGWVTADLSRFGYTSTTPLTYGGGTTWSGTFIATSGPGLPRIDTTNWQFTITASDSSGNVRNRLTNAITVDNEPPWMFPGPLTDVATYAVLNRIQPAGVPYVRIGDDVQIRVRLASSAAGIFDGQSVQVDLSSIGQGSPFLSWSGGWYQHTFSIATGTLADGSLCNDGATFPITIRDNNGNPCWNEPLATTVVPLISIPIDNVPPGPGTGLTVTITPPVGPPNPDFINLQTTATFTWAVSDVERDVGASSSCEVDVALMAGGATWLNMNWEGPANLWYRATQIATDTVNGEDYSGHQFMAIMTDKAGNRLVSYSSAYPLDCQAPIITAFTVTCLTPGIPPGVATIGSQLSFTCSVIGEDPSFPPTIDLRQVGGAAATPMTGMSSPYTLTHTIVQTIDPIGGIDNAPGTFSLTVRDPAFNYSYATATTIFNIDNVPPIAFDNGRVHVLRPALLPAGSIIPVAGPNLTFELGFSVASAVATLNLGATIIDLTAINGGAATPMAWTPVGPNGSFTISLPAASTTAEFPDYRFRVRVFDTGGNAWDYYSDLYQVDCQPPSFGSHNATFTALGGDNIVPWVSNTGDEILVNAFFNAPLDWVGTATLWATAGVPIADVALATTSVANWRAATFTIDGTWPALDLATISYTLSGVDDATNPAAPISASLPFAIDNVPLTLTEVTWSINPNLPDLNYINVASGAVGAIDLFWAIGTGSERLHSAWLDLSEFPGAPGSYAMTIVNGTTASSPTGINFRNYLQTDPLSPGPTFTLWLRDFGGHLVSTSTSPLIDTLRPSVSSASFDGVTLSVELTEIPDWGSFDFNEWRIVGSLTTGLPATLVLTGYSTLTTGLYSFDLGLSLAQRQTLAQWASTSLSLRLDAVATAPYTDLAGNWGNGQTAFPITLTSSSWRERPRVISMSVGHNWPGASFSVLLTFNKTITTWSASEAILLTQAAAETDNADYRYRYVVQVGSDSVWQPNPDQLQIDLCPDGIRWMVSRLGSGTTTLKFANRSSARAFVRDEIGIANIHIPTTAPIEATVTRPTVPLFEVRGSPQPYLDLASRTLTLFTTEDILAYTPSFRTDTSVLDPPGPPRMMPATWTSQAITTFRNGRITVHDQEISFATFTAMTMSPLDTVTNPLVASTGIVMHLAADDMRRILEILKRPTPPPFDWGLTVDAGAFPNWWGQLSQLFTTSGPGGLAVGPMPVVQAPTLAAVAIDDPTPVAYHASGTFHWELEFAPYLLGGDVAVGIASTTPRARVQWDSGPLVASGTFLGWTRRQVGSEIDQRYVARFVNTTDFPLGVPIASAHIDVFDVQDLFGNAYDLTATFVYDIATRIPTGATGYSVASLPLEVDTEAPTVTVVALSPVVWTPINSASFTVTFSEPMSPAWQPSLNLATSTPATALTFAFVGWDSPTTARYRNLQAIDGSVPQGTWNYTIAQGQDIAGNPHAGTATPVAVISQLAPVSAITMLTRQTTVSNAVLASDAFSPYVDEVTVGTGDASSTMVITFSTVPGPLSLPHRMSFRHATTPDIEVGSVVLTHAGLTAQAVFTATDLGYVIPNPTVEGPATFVVRIIDAVGNMAPLSRTIAYDALAPQLDTFTLTGIGTHTGNVYYARSGVSLGANLHSTNASDALRLTVSGTEPPVAATLTFALTQSPAFTYAGTIGTGLTPGTHTVSVVDAAGNLHTGSAPLVLQIDATAPVVVSIVPTLQTWGATAAQELVATVTFSERLDPNVLPTMDLRFGATTITMSFGGWVDPLHATVAWYFNPLPITSSFPPGTYSYHLAGGTDLAGNPLSFTASTAWEMNFQTQPPQPGITVRTEQPHLFSGPLVNEPFSPWVGSGIATFSVAYGAVPSFTPHLLLFFDSLDNQVATLSFTPTTPTFDVSTGTPATWYFDLGGIDAGPATYGIRVRDALGNIAPAILATMTFDSASPTIDALTLYDAGRGIASNGIRFYSPLVGQASITWLSDGNDPQRLVASGAATSTSPLLSFASAGGPVATPYGFMLATGTDLPEGLTLLRVADAAGNMGTGGASASLLVMVDRTAPTVFTASPAGPIGAQAIGSVTFDITFSEPMNEDPLRIPTVWLATATTPTPLLLGSATWLSPSVLRLTNQTAIASGIPQGPWDYVVSGGTDLAGNATVGPASGTQTIVILSDGAWFTATLISSQQSVTGAQLLYDQPFSLLSTPNTADMALTYVFGPLSLPHQALVYNPAGVQVATLPVSAPIGMAATMTVDAAFFADLLTPADLATGPITYTFRVRDSLGNFSRAPDKAVVYDGNAPNLDIFTLGNVGSFTGGVYYANPAVLGALTAELRALNATDALRLTLASSSMVATTTFALTSGAPGSYTTTFGAGLDQATYSVWVTDAAGNLATGVGPLTLRIDTTPPTVTAISPNFVTLGQTATGALIASVTFSERFEAGQPPTLALQLGASTIAMTFTGWSDPAVATTAWYQNAAAIDLTYISGTYSYVITGGADLAGNPPTFTPDPAVWALDIQTQGPIPAIAVLTEQPRLFVASLTGQPYSPLVAPAIATIRLDYGSAPMHLPHYLLIYDATGNIATQAFSPGAAMHDLVTSAAFWTPIGGAGAGPSTFTLRVQNSLGNISPFDLASFVYDSAIPTIDALTLTDGHGIATGGIRYYSPALGQAAMAWESSGDDPQRLVMVSGTATFPTPLASVIGPTVPPGAFRYGLATGSGLPEDLYTFFVADAAGNEGIGGGSSTLLVRTDSTRPLVAFATPTSPIGAKAANAVVFEIRFDEPMNPASMPTVALATSTPPTTIRLWGGTWVSSTTVQMTNQDPIAATIPQGSYDYVVSGGRDYAGNLNVVPASGSLTITILSQGPAFIATLAGYQRAVTGASLLYDRPFSPFIDPAPATAELRISYTSGPFSPDHEILVFDPFGTHVATHTLTIPIGATAATFTVDATFFGIPAPGAVGPSTFSYRLRDALGNLSDLPDRTVVYDGLEPNLDAFSLANAASLFEGVYYTNPTRGAVTASLHATNANDALRLLIASPTMAGTMTVALTQPNPGTYTALARSGFRTRHLHDRRGRRGGQPPYRRGIAHPGRRQHGADGPGYLPDPADDRPGAPGSPAQSDHLLRTHGHGPEPCPIERNESGHHAVRHLGGQPDDRLVRQCDRRHRHLPGRHLYLSPDRRLRSGREFADLHGRSCLLGPRHPADEPDPGHHGGHRASRPLPGRTAPGRRSAGLQSSREPWPGHLHHHLPERAEPFPALHSVV
jgi:hypothetical protein